MLESFFLNSSHSFLTNFQLRCSSVLTLNGFCAEVVINDPPFIPQTDVVIAVWRKSDPSIEEQALAIVKRTKKRMCGHYHRDVISCAAEAVHALIARITKAVTDDTKSSLEQRVNLLITSTEKLILDNGQTESCLK